MQKLFDMAAEAGVLGSMILDARVIPSVLELVDADSMFDDKNRAIYDAVIAVWLRDRTVDGLLVRAELDTHGALDLDHLQRVIDTVPSSANAMYYARLVAKKKHYRDMVVASDQIKRVLSSGMDPDEMSGQIQDLMSGLHANVRTEISTMADAEQVAEDALKQRNLVPTGFFELDGLLGGFGPGNMVVLAARPSMGKTALAVNIALNAAKRGEPVFIATLEMTPSEIKERIIASEADVNLRRVKQGNDTDMVGKFMVATQSAKDLPMYIAYGCNTPDKLTASVLRAKQMYGVKMVIVDYLQLMHCKRENRQQEITTISRMCKELALAADVPLVALSQLNRGVEARDDKRPRMSDLRESGSIEQDADLVLMLYREDYYRDPTEERDGITEILIKKNRHGSLGSVKLLFIEDCTRFENLSHAEVF